MMKKLLVSDFDRTLYVDCDISEKNLQALKRWKQSGNLFVIATGREEKALRGILHSYHLTTDYLICNNGARIVTWDGRTLFEQTMGDQQAWRIVETLIQKYHMAVDVTLKEEGIRIFKTLEEFSQILSGVLQIHIRFADTEQTKMAAEEIQKHYDVEAYANERNLDIVHCKIDKAEGISLLIEILKWKGEVIVIGDSFNDLKMIRRFGGYTLEAANEEIKRDASYICKDVADCISQIGYGS